MSLFLLTANILTSGPMLTPCKFLAGTKLLIGSKWSLDYQEIKFLFRGTKKFCVGVYNRGYPTSRNLIFCYSRFSFDPINNLGWLASCPKIFMGLALVHFQKYWLLSALGDCTYPWLMFKGTYMVCALFILFYSDKVCSSWQMPEKVEAWFDKIWYI